MYVLRTARDFSTVEELRINGALLVYTTVDSGIKEDQLVVFPDLNFTCNGSITAVRFLASDVPNTPNFIIGLGHKVNSDYEVIYRSTSLPMESINDRGTEFVVKYDRENTQYQRGQVLALKHNYPLLYRIGKTIGVCGLGPKDNVWPARVRCDDQEVYEPLLTIETGKP